ncbi:hypothetical protein CDL12_16292 [Handroanthus impetiginosus]|uniref:NAC domain-containing protein n=1 Tax=Handroanthus impetiginosus TaxID=429701 RepID=A0A2G9H0S8_9LAMI|nr:hypothetical protein CDL12_16292 [Handroanthus impetiginosus]
MEMESCVPPGFRFHPTEEELVGHYLRRKINSMKIDLDVIIDIDPCPMEPWDIQGMLFILHKKYAKERPKYHIIDPLGDPNKAIRHMHP